MGLFICVFFLVVNAGDWTSKKLWVSRFEFCATATNFFCRESMEMDGSDGSEDIGAESSYGITFTAEDAAVQGVRDVVLPSNLLSALAGVSPSAAPGYGLLSSTNPAFNVDHTRDSIIPGPNSVDFTQEYLIVDDPQDQAPSNDVEEEDDMIASLQMVGVIPFMLDAFKPRCSIHIEYGKVQALKNGDIVHLREISDGCPSVTIMQSAMQERATLMRGNLFTIVMVELDGGQYLNWALVNVSDQSGSQKGTELVNFESPREKLVQGRRLYLFVAYCQSQPFQLLPAVQRQIFNLRSFASTFALDDPVAAVYITIAAD